MSFAVLIVMLTCAMVVACDESVSQDDEDIVRVDIVGVDLGDRANTQPSPTPCCANEVVWDASAGIPPGAACADFVPLDPSTAPALTNGSLLVSTSEDRQNAGYEIEVQPSDTVQIRIRMQYVSGVSAAPWRSSAAVVFALGDNRQKNSLYIAEGEIFLLSAENTRGMPAIVATSYTLHDYVIDVNVASGAVRVSYDGTPVLSGELFVTPTDTRGNRITFGEISIAAFGTSLWQSFAYSTEGGCR